MKASEFVEIIRGCENSDGWSDWLNDQFYTYDDDREGIAKELIDMGIKVDLEDHFGGEGSGDEYWHVFSVTRNNEVTYFQICGSYASHYGHEFYDTLDFTEVKKVPVVRDEWQSV